MLTTKMNSNSATNSNLVVKKSSYCFNTMSRIETMKKAILQTEKLVNKTKKLVEIELNKILKNGNFAVDLQKLSIKIQMLREQLNQEKAELEFLKKRSLSFCERNNLSKDNLSHNLSNDSPNNLSNNLSNSYLPSTIPSSLRLSNSSFSNNQFYSSSSFSKEFEEQLITFNQDNLKKDKKLLNNIENEILFKSNLLKEINKSLSFTERMLITELFEIFPIKESQPNSGRFKILDLQIPDLNDPIDENDGEIKISLGYCCQLLITISKICDIPLKHSILFSGSQSLIVNETENPKLKDKKYPLFLNRDRTKFNIAIYLLNENISQIRHHFKLQTSDHKRLSFNLFNLLNDKLILKDEESANQISIVGNNLDNNHDDCHNGHDETEIN